MIAEVSQISIPNLEKIINYSNQCKITDDSSEQEAINFMADLTKATKSLDAMKKEKIGPTETLIKELKLIFAKKAEPLDKAVGLIKTKLLAYQQDKIRKQREEAEKKRKEEQERVAKEMEAEKEIAELFGDDAGMKELKKEAEFIEKAAIKSVMVSTRTDKATTSVRKDWTFELEDINLLLKNRPEFVIVDSVALNRAIKSDGERNIPGLKIFQKETINLRIK